MGNSLVLTICVIFVGAAVFSTIALVLRQSLLVAYIILGILVSYLGMDAIADKTFIHYSGDIGIIFLLFMLGLHLDPLRLVYQMKKVSATGLWSSCAFWIMGFIIMKLMGYTWFAAIFVGLSCLFSSTIIGLKLLPAQMMLPGSIGEVMISILLLQDFLAMIVLFLLHQLVSPAISWWHILMLSAFLPALVIAAFNFVDGVLEPLMTKYQRIREYLFLVAIAWGLGLAVLSEFSGVSYEIGAFIAGISLAHLSIANYLSDILVPLRDFFLVIFFFAVGMNIDLDLMGAIILPATILAFVIIIGKPYIYKFLFFRNNISFSNAWELGFRLGQGSEFTILMTETAKSFQFITPRVSNVIEVASLITFLVSSFIVVKYYRTPITRTASLLDDEDD